jgi:hypothetical protein
MATIKRRRRVQRGNTLTTEQEFELILGPNGELFGDSSKGSAFESEHERRLAWAEHAERLIGVCNPTMRPWAWWQYDSAEKQPRPGESEPAALERMGVLTAKEQRLLAARERE